MSSLQHFSPEKILASPTKLKILTILFKWQASDLTERQLAKLCGVSTFGVRHALTDLERSLIITKKNVGRAHLWTFNQSSFSFQALKPILEQLLNLPQPMEYLVKRLKEKLGQPSVEKIFLFGSILYDGAEAGDIDIAIILKAVPKCSVKKHKIREDVMVLSGELGPAIGKRLEAHVFTNNEWNKIRKTTLGKSIQAGQEIYSYEKI